MRKFSSFKLRKYIFLFWVFSIPYQLYITSGLSLSISLILLAILSVIMLISFVKDGILLTIRENRVGIILLSLLFSSITISYLLNIDYSSLKELLRWSLFFLSVIVSTYFVSKQYVDITSISRVFVLSVLTMILLSFYQLFVSQNTEFQIMSGTIGKLFNDPDLIDEKLSGYGKFNWIYGDGIRMHGFIANVSHYAFLLGLSIILTVEGFLGVWKKYYLIICTFIFAIIILTLVRSVLLAFLVVLALAVIISLFSRSYERFNKYFIIVIGGLIFAFVLAYILPDKLMFQTLLVRLIESVTLDGAIFPDLLSSFSHSYEKVGINNEGFNEYGGVGGRYGLWKIVIFEIILPKLSSVSFLLFGLGPAALGNHLADVSNVYFRQFSTTDNSILQWFSELGLFPFSILTVFIFKYIRVLCKYIISNISLILFIAINFIFFNILPDIRLGMIVAVIIAVIYGKTKK